MPLLLKEFENVDRCKECKFFRKAISEFGSPCSMCTNIIFTEYINMFHKNFFRRKGK